MKLGSKKAWCSHVPLRLKSKCATRFCMFPKFRSGGKTPGNAPVYLNVYDLTPFNGYVYWAGIGIFHSGVEVHGVEYSFGAHDYPTSGIFEVEPRQCPGFKFRKSVFIGTTGLDPIQVRELMGLYSLNYYGDSYHLIAKNCNHFCKDICYKLTGNLIPKWINRLAKIGSACSCLLPEAFRVSAVHHGLSNEAYDGEKQRLKNDFCCVSSTTTIGEKQLSASSLILAPLQEGVPPLKLPRSAAIMLKGM